MKEVPARKKKAPPEYVTVTSDKFGPISITVEEPATMADLVELVADYLDIKTSEIKVATMRYQLKKNGKPQGEALPLKDADGLSFLQERIGTMAKAISSKQNNTDYFHVEIVMARPKSLVQKPPEEPEDLDIELAEPVNNLGRLLGNAKTLDKKLQPVRDELTALYRPGGELHCGEPAHRTPCAVDVKSQLHWELDGHKLNSWALSIVHDGNDFKKIPTKKPAFKAEKARASHTASTPTQMQPAVPSMTGGTPDLMAQFMMMMQQQQQQQMQQQQQQQQMMMQQNAMMMQSFMGSGRYPLMFGNSPSTPSPGGQQMMFANASPTPFHDNGFGGGMPPSTPLASHRSDGAGGQPDIFTTSVTPFSPSTFFTTNSSPNPGV
ncbi:hypothetical protein GGX14DRAFT_448692 [Mycena pura]|uniref:Uncharacterized protein n=1 Tax=Mycena pura TaxID=153505 RepID=A0AAD6VID6_9AGAR|nr:hypothetical protein GGX14DRAFT_448692 [Mycena pura]